jgi:tetratricopeptide (TPR) repeat protein
VDERVRQAELLYERAVFSGDAGPLTEADRELDAAEADLAVARGRLMHTRFLLSREQDPETAEEDPGELPLFERAAGLYRALGDIRGEAEALFWVGCLHQVVRRDNAVAVPILEESLERASRAGDMAVMAETLRHLGIAAHAAGRLDAARQYLEESTRLRRETGQLAGAAANMVGLAYVAAAQGRGDDAVTLLDEADAIAGDSQAHRILEQVSEARAALPGITGLGARARPSAPRRHDDTTTRRRGHLDGAFMVAVPHLVPGFGRSANVCSPDLATKTRTRIRSRSRRRAPKAMSNSPPPICSTRFS